MFPWLDRHFLFGQFAGEGINGIPTITAILFFLAAAVCLILITAVFVVHIWRRQKKEVFMKGGIFNALRKVLEIYGYNLQPTRLGRPKSFDDGAIRDNEAVCNPLVPRPIMAPGHRTRNGRSTSTTASTKAL